MISIIICSLNETLCKQCTENIAATIGVEHEVLAIDNRIKNAPICEVYNEAAKRARYDILCFLHEDILFHTADWGKSITGALSDDTIGIVGICGGTYKAKVSSAWIDIPHSYRRANMKSKDKNGNLIDYVIKSDATKNISDTVTLDGLCLMMRKNVWQEFKFDEKNIRGFHYYDLDISIRVLEKYRLVVCHDIFIEHLSAGNFGTAWIDETFLFHEKFRDRLPLSVTAINAAEKSSLESFAMKRFLEKK